MDSFLIVVLAAALIAPGAGPAGPSVQLVTFDDLQRRFGEPHLRLLDARPRGCSGSRQGDLSQCPPTARPMAAPARSSHAELRRQRARSTPLATANPAVVPSMIATRPSSQVTAASSASDATLTPSRKA